VLGRKFLDYSLLAAPKGEVRRTVSVKAQEMLKQRIRQLARRSCERSMTEVVEPRRRYMWG
jgi:RNA-directed DNA polymerase